MTPPVSDGYPRVQGRCLGCGRSSLFLGEGGYVTCSRLDCGEPTAVTNFLMEDRRSLLAAIARLVELQPKVGFLAHS